MSTTISLINMKGGVGKTTLAFNLSTFDLHLQSIRIENWADRIKRARWPGTHSIQHRISDSSNQAQRNFHAINLFQLTLNLSLPHAASGQ